MAKFTFIKFWIAKMLKKIHDKKRKELGNQNQNQKQNTTNKNYYKNKNCDQNLANDTTQNQIVLVLILFKRSIYVLTHSL